MSLTRKKPMKRSGPIARTTRMKPSGPIKPKKPASKSAKWYRNKCDELCRQICKVGQKCVCCGRTDQRLEWAHCKSRTFLCIRYDKQNYCCLCWGCHNHFTTHPDLWTDWINATYPGRWDYLNGRIQSGVKINWPVMYAALKAEHELTFAEVENAA